MPRRRTFRTALFVMFLAGFVAGWLAHRYGFLLAVAVGLLLCLSVEIEFENKAGA